MPIKYIYCTRLHIKLHEFLFTIHYRFKQPYSESKLELESNLGKILPVNCKFIRCSTSTYPNKSQTRVPKVRLSVQKRKIQTDKNIFASLEFDFFRVQLKFAFRIRRKDCYEVYNMVKSKFQLFFMFHNDLTRQKVTKVHANDQWGWAMTLLLVCHLSSLALQK